MNKTAIKNVATFARKELINQVALRAQSFGITPESPGEMEVGSDYVIINSRLWRKSAASCIDIYLVAYVAETYGTGKEKFYEYIRNNGISNKINSAQAIWQVGKGDGVFLGIRNNDGTVKDWDFINEWINGKANSL